MKAEFASCLMLIFSEFFLVSCLFLRETNFFGRGVNWLLVVNLWSPKENPDKAGTETTPHFQIAIGL
ncbi:hypothetical protein OVS_02325 [Mycoplasma ovis str. Michigan]|uniref:Lipoprotein n=1 Tax=Mycoplasma ovis str. Michigan TaxID=1415773 RepID=A0ABM5P1F6_9MOLU|nr:hypothetical protein OVS_02325 [Mycoplasma ovis str. Michigan]